MRWSQENSQGSRNPLTSNGGISVNLEGRDGKIPQCISVEIRGIQACFGPSDPFTGLSGIVVNPSNVCFLLGPRNPLTSFGRIHSKS